MQKIKQFTLCIFLFFLFCLEVEGKALPPQPERQLIVEKVEIEGNNKTKPGVIYTYVTIKQGDVVSPDILLENSQRLQNTRFFKTVDVYTRPGSEKGKLVVIVEVKERKWPYYKFEGGNSELDGWFIIPVSFRFDNFFGSGNKMNWQFKIGNRISGTSFNFHEKQLFSSKLILNSSLFAESQHLYYYYGGVDSLVNVSNSGLRFQLIGHKNRYKQFFCIFEATHNKPEEDANLEQYLSHDFRNIFISSIQLGTYVDKRDNSIFPTSGFWGTVSNEFSLRSSNNTLFYHKFIFDSRLYLKLNRKHHVLALRLKGGITGNNTPFYKRFYLGGPYSIRGYKESRLTPPGWSTNLLLMQAELRIPLGKKDFPNHRHSMVLFYDNGGYWEHGKLPGYNDFFGSVGFGYRLKIKYLGIMRLDVGFPVNNVIKEDVRFHLTMGRTF